MKLLEALLGEDYKPEDIKHPVDEVFNLLINEETALGWFIFNAGYFVASYIEDEKSEDDFEDSEYTYEDLIEEDYYPNLSREESTKLYQYLKTKIDAKKFIESIEDNSEGYTVKCFMSPEYVPSGTWLYHFSDNADGYEGIISKGFTLGVDEPLYLGLTTYKSKHYEGYNFAYTQDDVERYSKGGWGSRGKIFKYGKWFVMFKAEQAIKAWHYGDQEPQVIFWGSDATDIILFNIESPDDIYTIANEIVNDIDEILSSESDDMETEIKDYMEMESRYDTDNIIKNYINSKYSVDDIINNTDDFYAFINKLGDESSIASIYQKNNKKSINILLDFPVDDTDASSILDASYTITKMYDEGKFK